MTKPDSILRKLQVLCEQEDCWLTGQSIETKDFVIDIVRGDAHEITGNLVKRGEANTFHFDRTRGMKNGND